MPMEDELMANEGETTWQCPKDGVEMQPMGRRSGAWRCPACRGVFIDTAAMRRGRGGQRPAWWPVLGSVLLSLVATFTVRRLLRRARRQILS